MDNLIAGNLRFEKMQGVGTMDINFAKDKNTYVLIGENGIGKTKFLESLFTTLLLSNQQVLIKQPYILNQRLPFSGVKINGKEFKKNNDEGFCPTKEDFMNFIINPFPIVYLSASNRSNIDRVDSSVKNMGSNQTRREEYLEYLIGCFDHYENELKNLNMKVNLEEWIIQRAQSSNKYQTKEDNREIEIHTLLTLLNKMDNRIDGSFLEISGDNRVFIKVENQKRELSELSSGFTAILKLLQGIIAGYSYFTNETQIQNVRGFVLIDEIESHLHNEWQVKIVPLLKTLFPNTTFVITTHSSLVISQLEQGEAYRLERANDGVVYGKEIKNPNKITFVDLMQNAFSVDLNQLKIDRANQSNQEQGKAALLNLIKNELDKMESK
ncbi:AAA family ATPase [Phocoenobacter atlanticus]|uniref:AAA family ATPase n=1 Tax=Phocoenobacter atlanticus TaxID=3416742 RepID=UPI0027492C19|nr:AAA family ATPase [Pasteurella atlantica]MDP8101843.1 AAA family ATPase [Pasteurella atlantica]